MLTAVGVEVGVAVGGSEGEVGDGVGVIVGLTGVGEGVVEAVGGTVRAEPGVSVGVTVTGIEELLLGSRFSSFPSDVTSWLA